MTQEQFTRRAFLLSSLVGVSCAAEFWADPLAWAKKGKAPTQSAGPHAIARQDWPPAIVPDHIGSDRGFCFFTDEFGRLAVVDMRKPSNAKAPPHVVAELNGLGKKVIDFQVVPGRAYAAVLKEGDEPQPALVCINLTPATDPAVIGQVPLDKFAEVTCLSANGDLICVGGTTAAAENLVAIYSVPRKGKQLQPSLISTWTAQDLIVKVDLQDRHLAVLQPSALDYISLVEPHSPESVQTLKLDGDFKSLARYRDTAIVVGIKGGASGNKCVAISVALEPAPRIVSVLPLEPIVTALDCSGGPGRFLVLGDGTSDRFLASITFDKNHQLHKEQTVSLPSDKGGFSAKSNVLLSGRTAYIGAGWAGVQVMSWVGGAWSATYRYSIPRMPASSIATWGDNVVLAGSDLKLYDIAQPDKPSLVNTTNLVNSVKSIVGAGSFVLCLSRDAVSLRKMGDLATVAATCDVDGQHLCFDKVEQKAYVLKDQDQKKKTVLTKLKVYSNSIVSERTYDLPGDFVRGSANGGGIAVCGLNDVALYGLGERAELIGARHFENLAIRDILLTEDYILAAAVDQKSKGFLLILGKDQNDLRVVGSLKDLPHDAVALAADKSRVVVVGKSADGKDIATVIDISKPSTPKLVSTVAAVEAASTVAIRDKYAIVGGRGIEILSLT